MTLPPDDLAAMDAVLTGPPAPAIVAAEAALRRAQLAADVAMLDRLVAEDLLFAGPDGQLATKADDLAMHRSGAVRFRAHEPEELRVRPVTATVAVSSLRAWLAVEVHGTRHEGTFRYTRVWAQQATGDWQVVAGQVSAMAAPDDAD